MALSAGTRLGPYEVTSQIGVGGMGEVYRARDTKLDRDVAIKVLPEAFAADPERIARFQREAKTLASLNHPHVAAIYGLEESGGTRALVMELVEGEDLSQRIARGAIPLDDALPIAKQIAEALAAAHEQGIIHRDLKPANIKVTSDGVVKVLDFGLAKLAHPESAGHRADVTASPTITSPAMMTSMGVLLGTAAYMSPEQAKGREADKRSDVWAFGAVLYEMLTGRRPFDGEDMTDVLSAVVRLDPNWEALPSSLPQPVRTLLQGCLVKDRRKRIADIAVALFVLEKDAGLAPDTTAHEATWRAHVDVAVADARRALQRSTRRRVAVVGVAALVAGTLAASAIFFFIQRPMPQPVTRLAIPTTGDAAAAYDPNDRAIAVSPDGSKIVYTGASSPVYGNGIDSRLYVRALDQLEPTLLAGPGGVREPFFSPDGAWIGFFDPNTQLRKVSADGGPPVPLATTDGPSRGATWGPDDTIIFATSSPATGLQRISANGGNPTVLTRPNREKGESDHLWPHVLPGGHAVLFTIVPNGPIENALIAVLDLRDGSQKVVLRGGSDARYVEGGYLVYGIAGTLRAVGFDVDRLEVRGTPVPVLQQVVTTSAVGAANFAVAANGTLTYVSGGTVAGERLTLVWVDRSGREEPLKVPPRAYMFAQLSPDGTRVALYINDRQQDVWIWDLARETLQRLTFDPGSNLGGVWTPDGKRVAFSRALGGFAEIYWQAADGSGTGEALTKGSGRNMLPTGFLPDASALLYEPTIDPRDIGMVRVAGDQPSTWTPLLAGAANERGGTVSPDGRWLAYQSDESGRAEIYVRPFPRVDAGLWQVSTAGGTRPRWGRNGRELFYIAGGTGLAVMSVAVDAGATFMAGSPVMLFQGNYIAPNTGRLTYDVSLDGKRFLMIKAAEAEATPPQIIVVHNWLEELKRLVPAN